VVPMTGADPQFSQEQPFTFASMQRVFQDVKHRRRCHAFDGDLGW